MEEYIQQMNEKIEEDEEIIKNLKEGNDVEDNIGFIFEIHKNIAGTQFYKDVVQEDPVVDSDLD